MRKPMPPLALLACGAAALMIGGCDRGETPTTPAQEPAAAAAAPARAPAGPEGVQLAYAKDRDWISLNGKVMSTMAGAFMLDYGTGNVLVEMDDWDWYQEGKLLRPGDEVIVAGYVDKNRLNESVEASGVYVKNLGTYFHASGADEERIRGNAVRAAAAPGAEDVTGTVRSIEGRHFTIGLAGNEMRVDTKLMVDNPLDDKGFLQVRPGDRVYVYGDLDIQKREAPEIIARGIIKLSQDRTKTS